MGMFDFIKSKVQPPQLASSTPTFEVRQKAVSIRGSSLQILGGTSIASERRGFQGLLTAYNSAPHLRSVVGRVSKTFASVTWSASGAKASQISKLMAQWNPRHTGRAARELCEIWLLMTGNAFAVIERNAAGDPVELWPVPPTLVSELPSADNGRTYLICLNGVDKSYPEADVLHWCKINPANPYGYGVGIASSLDDEIDTDEAAAKHSRSVLQNRGIPAALIVARGMEEDQLRSARALMEERNQGPLKAGRTHWVGGDGVDFHRLDDSITDLALVDLRKFEQDIIRQTFNVPPEVIGNVDSSNRATAQEAMAILSDLVIIPELEEWREFLQARLVPQFKGASNTVLSYDSPVPISQSSKLEVAKNSPGVFTVNEMRAIAGLPPLQTGGDVLIRDLPPANNPQSEAKR